MKFDAKQVQLNETAQTLLKKIQTKTATIGVVGLGYVGLPLAVEKAKAGYKVIGFDVQQSRVDQVNNGINYIGDVVDAELAEIVSDKKLLATTDFSLIQEVDAIAICVPTPLDRYQQPDTSYIEVSAKEIATYLHKGMLVVLESTTYPGTTKEILNPVLEETGLVCGEDFFVAYSPERVDPGNKSYNTKNTPKVIGGVTGSCTVIAGELYRSVLDGDVHLVSDPSVAEMEKILENTFRHINIALANEMAILCNRMGIDVWEVIDAASSKPYGFMPFYPGPGLGGHCIPLDPFYLTWKAREYNYHTRLIELSGEINNGMPEYIMERLMRVLNNEGKAVRGSKVLVLGLAYKKDIDDLRESPSLRILEELDYAGADWVAVDPHIASFKHNEKIVETVGLTKELLQSADLVVITTDHTSFDYEMIATHSQVLFDTRNAVKQFKDKSKKYYRL